MPHEIWFAEMNFGITKTYKATKTGKKRKPEYRESKMTTSVVVIDDKIHDLDRYKKRLNLSPAESCKLKSFNKITPMGKTIW